MLKNIGNHPQNYAGSQRSRPQLFVLLFASKNICQGTEEFKLLLPVLCWTLLVV
jgi:hypothetical protein